MPETVMPGPVSEDTRIREATCIHTQKIYDSCQSRDCMEDLRVYLTTPSQTTLTNAQSVRSGRAELLYVTVAVEPMGFQRGFYTIDSQYYYRINADAYLPGSARPAQITGLAMYAKRCMLFGSQGGAKVFSSDLGQPTEETLSITDDLPTAVVEAVDPILLSMRMMDCTTGTCPVLPVPDVPAAILDTFDDEIDLTAVPDRQLFATLGQFTLLRLERDSQMVIPVYDYCMPSSECDCGTGPEDDPCQLFQRVDFPVNEFFPPATADSLDPVAQLRNVGCSVQS